MSQQHICHYTINTYPRVVGRQSCNRYQSTTLASLSLVISGYFSGLFTVGVIEDYSFVDSETTKAVQEDDEDSEDEEVQVKTILQQVSYYL